MENDIVIEPIVEAKAPFKWRLVLLITFLIIVIFSAYFFLVRAPNNFPMNQIFSVESGDGLRKISLKLKNAGYIQSRVALETVVIFYAGDRHIMVGDYIFPEKINVIKLAKKIAGGDRELSTVKITIPEGFSNEEIAELCDSRLRNFNKDRFLAAASNKHGTLFPDTYFFSTTDDEDIVLSILTKNFDKKTEKIWQDIKNSGKDINEILIMASVLEKEASGDSDRAIISGILWKRISIGMPLQVDAAPVTYEQRGLPKEPISNPGIAAILAAINPEESKYLYYIHDKEGNTHYAKNFDEHRQNIKKYLK